MTIQRIISLTILVGLFTLIGLNSAKAQTEVTFNVNLKPQMEDSAFVPTRGDIVQLKGNLFPLDPNQYVTMEDQEPIDSVYTVQIDFPRNQQGKTLSYSFVLKLPDETMTEPMPRQISLRGGEVTLDPIYFGAFAY